MPRGCRTPQLSLDPLPTAAGFMNNWEMWPDKEDEIQPSQHLSSTINVLSVTLRENGDFSSVTLRKTLEFLPS